MSTMSETETQRPAWRNPFLWLFIVGAVLLTLAAPRFRKVAPPPEITGKLPAWALADQDGHPIGSQELAGHVVLMAIVSDSAPDAARRVALGLATIAPRVQVARADVRFVLIDVDGRDAATRSAWLSSVAPGAPIRVAGLGEGIGAGMGEAACALAIAGFAPGQPTGGACQAAQSLARDAKLLLVDAAGNTRGLYGSSGEPLYEAFERALRTCDEASAAR